MRVIKGDICWIFFNSSKNDRINSAIAYIFGYFNVENIDEIPENTSDVLKRQLEKLERKFNELIKKLKSWKRLEAHRDTRFETVTETFREVSVPRSLKVSKNFETETIRDQVLVFFFVKIILNRQT